MTGYPLEDNRLLSGISKELPESYKINKIYL